jgi:hypothetical protein
VAAEAAARQAKIEAARLRKLSAEAREADARARAAEADTTARLEAARETATRQREIELARIDAQRATAVAARRMAEAKALEAAISLNAAERAREKELSVGQRPLNEYMLVAGVNAKLRKLPERAGEILETLPNGTQVHVVGILPNGWAQVADEGEPVGWIYRASLRETKRSVADYRPSVARPSGTTSALFKKNYPFPEGKVNRDAVAVLIGNRNYPHPDVPMVAFAHNDLEVMRQFVIKTLGYREGNVYVEKDASKAVFQSYFGDKTNHRGRVFDNVIEGVSDVFVYVSGHGVPGDDKNGYLLPVDGVPGQVGLTAYNVRTLVENMNKVPARSVTIALDTCFSGISQGGSLIKAASAIFVRPKFKALGRVTLLTAATGAQTASWDTGAQLGLFTRYFIEGMLGGADGVGGKGNGAIELYELKRFLGDKVRYQARRRYSRDQVPEVLGSLDRVMTTSLSPGFSFGDPNIELPIPVDRLRDRRASRPTPARELPSPDEPESNSESDILGTLFKSFWKSLPDNEGDDENLRE